MLKAIDKPREDISEHAPRLLQLKIKPDDIGKLIGPG
jgi:polyribonucleotide nucleotidyltransferase